MEQWFKLHDELGQLRIALGTLGDAVLSIEKLCSELMEESNDE